jgi:hypothetical protein
MLNPLGWLFKYSDTVIFEVSGDIEQAVERLSRSASKPVLQATWGEASEPSLVGSVSSESVRLHKVTPMFGNVFKPIFFGKFQTRDHKRTLVGTFKMGLLAQVVVWFSVIMGLTALIVALPSLEPAIFIVGGTLVVLSCKIPAKGDVEWIKRRIETALANK